MTQQEIYREVLELPLQERKELIKRLSQNLEFENTENGSNESTEKEFSTKEKKAAYLRLRGALKMDNPPMTKEEVREIYYERLAEKYK